MSSFIEPSDLGFDFQLGKFVSKIGIYSTPLGITAGEITDMLADATLFNWTYQVQASVQDFSHNITAFKNLVRYGNGSEVISALPVPPTFPAGPALVGANVQERFSILLARVKSSPNYTTAMGEDLGIEPVHVPFDPETGMPVFKINHSSGGHPHLIWKKGKFQGVEIWVDRNDTKGWVKLDRDFHPDYTDKAPLPGPGQSAVWKYKMIYIFKDEVVGNWSAELSITVYGSV